MNTVRETLQKRLEETLERRFGLTREVHLETPRDRSHGDYATNLAMTLAKELKRSPREIAGEIQQSIDDSFPIIHIDVAGPGFLNFTIDKSVYLALIGEILQKQDAYGRTDEGRGQRINLEFVSANPTGSLHVGHARGAAIGDSLARVFEKTGFDVTREYYVNDGGNQIRTLARSIEARYRQLFGEAATLPEDGYPGQDIIDLAERMKARHGDRFLKEDGFETFRDEGVEWVMESLIGDLADFGVTFDVFFRERSLYSEGAVEKTLKRLSEAGHTYSEDGATFLRTSLYGDEKDRVVVKQDGTYTYLLPDLAYHLDKLERGYDTLIDVLGADHHGYVPRLKGGIGLLSGDHDRLEVVMLQIVRVLQDGEEIKMSKRSGKAITLRDLIEMVGGGTQGRDAVRYFFARHHPNTHMDLDLDLAVRKSNENPVYYAQYAHARIASVFAKAKREGYTYRLDLEEFTSLDHEKVYQLLEVLAEYPQALKAVVKERSPHKITNYIHTLAQALHGFYTEIVVLTDDERARSERLMVLEAVRIVLADALSLIGVSAPREM